MTDAMIERAAGALVFEQSNGCCRLDQVCDLCDCNPEMTWAYARQQASAMLDAALPVVDTDNDLDAVLVAVSECAEFAVLRDRWRDMWTISESDRGEYWAHHTPSDDYPKHAYKIDPGGAWFLQSFGSLRVIWTPEVTA